MKRPLLALAVILTLQVAWVLGTVAVQEHGLRSAPTVLLETQPVDPRDLLRGDYVILNYKISRIPLNLFQPPLADAPAPGTAVFVTLTPQGAYHEAASASLERPTIDPDQIVIRGITQSLWRLPGTSTAVAIEYGLERYYVAEGTGQPAGKVTVQAAIRSSGQASIKEVYLDGVPYRQAIRQQLGDDR
jgi:uncharacterized membrane-anchored protein